MQILDQAVEAIGKQGAKGRVNGAPLAMALETIAGYGEQAVRLWQDYLDNPGAPGDKYTIVSWIGPERAKQLHELSLKAHELVSTVCAAAGDQARFLVLDESPIVLAYRGLKEGETGPQAAQASIAAQHEHIQHLRVLADRVRTFKSGAKTTTKPAVKKKVTAKKPVTKKAVKKAAKKK